MLNLEIHCCDSNDWQRDASRVLCNEELSYAESMASSAHRARFFAGRLLVRRMLCKAYGGLLSEWRLTSGQNSKPVIEGASGIHFSIAHSGNCILCAISDVAVGIDVERLKPGRDVCALAREVCHPDEMELLLTLPAEHRSRLFMQYWVLKEAWLKRCGMGLDIAQMRMLSAFPDRHADALTTGFVDSDSVMLLSVVAGNIDELNLDTQGRFTIDPFKRWRLSHDLMTH